MPITSSDLVQYLTGAGSDGGSQNAPNSSLGNYRSSTTLSSGVARNLFDDIGAGEAQAGNTDYRCYCIKNTHGSLALQSAKVFISTAVNDADATISYAVERPSTAGATNGNAQTVANEATSPTVNTTDHNGVGSGISDWGTGTDYAGGIGVNQGSHGANLAAGELIFVWVKRVYASGSLFQTGVSVSLNIQGDTA